MKITADVFDFSKYEYHLDWVGHLKPGVEALDPRTQTWGPDNCSVDSLNIVRLPLEGDLRQLRGRLGFASLGTVAEPLIKEDLDKALAPLLEELGRLREQVAMSTEPEVVDAMTAELERLRSAESQAAARTLLLAALAVIGVDGHIFGSRPCPTCRAVSAMAGQDFGCVAFAKRRNG